MGRTGFFTAMLVSSLVIAGCGDPPLCPGETVLLIERLPVTTDTDGSQPGVQTDVIIWTTAVPNTIVTLEVVDIGGDVLASRDGVVQNDRRVLFANVSIPQPRAVLRAKVEDDICGDAQHEIGIDVLVGGNCSLTLSPTPLANDHFAPLGVLNKTTDVDPAPGHQAQVAVETLPASTVEIFASGPQGELSLGSMLATSGSITIPVTLPEGQVTIRATCAQPGTTSASPATTLVVDTTAPTCELVAPASGVTITPDNDLDDNLANGIQLVIAAHVDGSDVIGEPATLDVTQPGGMPATLAASPVDGLGNTTVTAALDPIATPTQFTFELRSQDHARNPCTTSNDHAVALTFVSFAAPAADGAVSRNDGSVSGTSLTFPLCGSVTRDNATVTVTVDGGAAQAATVTGRDWCVTITVSESASPHTVNATAIAGTDTGSSTLSLAVDVTPPTQVGAFAANAVNRQRIETTWTAPSDGSAAAPSYIAKLASGPLTEQNFDTTGVVVATGVPRAPGTPEALTLFPARTGTQFFFGIAAVDDFGNRGPAAIAGPLEPQFDKTGAIVAPDTEQGLLGFGSAIAHGRFNDDDFADVAIGAPNRNEGVVQRVGAVYVYFGGPSGIGSSPDLIIKGELPQGRFGAAVTAFSHSSDVREDLVIGSPGGDGRLLIFTGGAALGTGTRLASSANAKVRVDTGNPGWFAASGLGTRVVACDIDGDDVQDLVTSAPGGGGGDGGVVILYGDTLGDDVALSDVDPAGSGTTISELIRDPGAGTSSRLGFYLWAVGETEGPTDNTDDLVLAYSDDQTTAGDSLYVFRGDGTRPTAPGVTTRAFAPARDVRIDFVTATIATDWGSAVGTIEDQDGDGANELVISAYRQNRTMIITGGILGAGGVVTTADSAVVRTTINGGPGVTRLGAAIAANDGRSTGDVDGDGREDLVIGGLTDGIAHLFVWFGGAIPTGTVTASSAAFAIPLGPPNTFRAPGEGQAGVAEWIADTNADGLDDLCVASPIDNASDGLFEVLWDETP